MIGRKSRWLNWLLSLLLLVPLLGPASTAFAVEAAQAAAARAKIDPALAEGLEISGSHHVRFLVRMGEQADTMQVSKQVRAQTAGLERATQKASVRRAVVQALQETADRTQIRVLQLLKTLQREGHVSDLSPLWVVNGLIVTGDSTAAQQIAELTEVAALAPERLVRFTPPPDTLADPVSSTTSSVLWNVSMVGAPQAWEAGYDGTGVVIASLDTGVDWNHPALKQSFRGYDPANPNIPQLEGNWLDVVNGYATPPYDDQGHGTHTVGTMVGYDAALGTSIGVAPGAKWIAVKAFDADSARDSWLLEAGQWLMAPLDSQGTPHPEWAPDIINNS